MKTFWAMLGALLISIIIMELGMVFLTYDKVYSAMEHALDAAIVAGTREQKVTHGELIIDTVLAERTATHSFQTNLNLDNNLENSIMKNTSFSVVIVQDIEMAKRPYIRGNVVTTVTALSPKLFGKEGYDIDISKTQFQVSDYK